MLLPSLWGPSGRRGSPCPPAAAVAADQKPGEGDVVEYKCLLQMPRHHDQARCARSQAAASDHKNILRTSSAVCWLATTKSSSLLPARGDWEVIART
eukprot:CAMPEP_0178982824 /NCGR_PEP_ID=MMETSP0795-20121207/712_1 /TAXON_ID=88552 /ORGANISM="Amoebophrya sp., Strain Ameob2" /LENGTH=96 /DNA_ID=CAMNT_0020673515 /DNA_START=1094 /DNA_END=1384 /DNA_ORIENTATION=+